MTTKHKALELADEWRNKDLKVWHREHYQDWGDKSESLLRTIPALEAKIEHLEDEIVS